MILYHTSDREIVSPDIHHGRKNADFGWGFYLTPDRDFTFRWARENAVVNEYELDEAGLDIHRFPRDVSWFQYIFHNRRLQDGLTADVIIGPIANDTIFDTFGIITSGYLKPEDALKLLFIGPEYTQVAIKTEKAVKQLRFIRSEKIERMDREALKMEQNEYQEEFAAAIEKMYNK
ncbi:MAG: DUF3990 domain-containing protein [Clostridia bacterium]|nr:DUF3990 domain-containing protein [Clostridia bacterium]